MVSKFIKRGTKKENPWEYRKNIGYVWKGTRTPSGRPLMTCTVYTHIHQRTDLAPILTQANTLVLYSNCYKSCSYSLHDNLIIRNETKMPNKAEISCTAFSQSDHRYLAMDFEVPNLLQM